MRKLLVLTLAAWLGLGAAVASADVFVFAEIQKFKDVVIVEEIFVNKFVSITATVDVLADKAAESHVLVNQLNTDNMACTNCDEKADTINNSGNNNTGVVSVNQAAGNMNNQGNAVAIAVDVAFPGNGTPPPTPQQTDGFAEAQAAADQRNFFNMVNTVNLLFRDAFITGSFNGSSGIVHANQSTGNMNNQVNALSIALSLEAGVALSEADLGQVNAFNVNWESDASGVFGINKSANIVGSLNGNTGVIGVNQSSGNMANQGNVVSIASTFSQ